MNKGLTAGLMLDWFIDRDETALSVLADMAEEQGGSGLREVLTSLFRSLANDPRYIAGLNPDLWIMSGRN